MKLPLFLGLATAASLTISLFILFTDTPVPQATYIDERIPPSELVRYLHNKGKSNWISDGSSFAQIMNTPASAILGIQDESSSSETTDSAIPKISEKSSYTIAFLGDSMIDTLGPGIPELAKLLQSRYPNITFNLLNYGAGATNFEYGLSRLTSDFSYLGVQIPSLLSKNPDVVIVESFAYNHWENTQSDLDRQWLTIAKAIDTIKKHNVETQIVLAATIAPFCPTYTDGSANLPLERKYVECQTVKAYLKNMANFATSQKYPFINAYHASLNGDEGTPKYINQSDHIHPSTQGRELFANTTFAVLTKLLPM